MMRTMRRGALVALLGLLVAPAAQAADVRPVAEAKVSIDNFSFAPATLTVVKGTRVTFTNHDDIPHLVVAAASPPPWKSPVLDTDDAFAQTFDRPGTYAYFCSLHPHMQGKIVVK